MLSLVGGKWTTFRSFAELATDRILALLARQRRVSTRDRAYPGVGVAATDPLTRRYGALAATVAAFCVEAPDRPLVAAPAYTRREVIWLIRARAACTLEDLVLRRTQLALGAELSVETLADLAGILAAEIDKGPDWVAAQVAKAKADPRILGLRHHAHAEPV